MLGDVEQELGGVAQALGYGRQRERVLAGSPMQMSEVKRVAGAAADGAPGLPDA